MAQPRRTVGIDFGTSTSLVAEGAALQPASVVPLGRATSSLPSWVGLHGDGLVVGEDAQDLPLGLVARSVKRAITRGWSSVPLEGDHSRAVDADEAISAVLREIGNRARARGVHLTEESTRLGCPAMWTGPQRARLLGLARDAGLPVADHTLVDEPIAAGVAWVTHRVHDHLETIKGRVLVFDMGGGTLDVALLDVEASPGGTPEISVLASAGIDKAGDQLDVALMDDLFAMLSESGVDGADPSNDSLAAVVLREARRVKEMLSTSTEVLAAPRHPQFAMPQLPYTRAQLEVAFEPQLREAEELVWATIRESLQTHELAEDPMVARAKTKSQLALEVQYVVQVGGMSRIPAVGDRLDKMFPSADHHHRLGDRVAPDEAIVAGLSDTTGYDRINLHRPGFDFVLQWPENPEGLVIYKAYSRFYEWWAPMQGSRLYFEHVVPARRLPSKGEGVLRIRSAVGNDVDLNVDGDVAQGLAVPFGGSNVRLRLYPNGRILVTDGKERQQEIRVNRWPVLRGTQHATILAKRLSPQLRPVADLPWYMNYENMRP